MIYATRTRLLSTDKITRLISSFSFWIVIELTAFGSHKETLYSFRIIEFPSSSLPESSQSLNAMSGLNGDVQSQVNQNKNGDIFVRFPDVIEGKIDTVLFLDAARAVVRIVDKFGKVFAPVKYDMEGNINKLNTKYSVDKERHKTLQDMILLEKSSRANLIATDALMWLRRGLYMIQLFFDKIIEDHKTGKASEDLVAFLKRAYKEALEPYHGWMAQQLFGLLSRMVPTRTQLLEALVDERRNKNDAVIEELELVLIGLRENLQTLVAFYIEHSLENDAKV